MRLEFRYRLTSNPRLAIGNEESVNISSEPGIACALSRSPSSTAWTKAAVCTHIDIERPDCRKIAPRPCSLALRRHHLRTAMAACGAFRLGRQKFGQSHSPTSLQRNELAKCQAATNASVRLPDSHNL